MRRVESFGIFQRARGHPLINKALVPWGDYVACKQSDFGFLNTRSVRKAAPPVSTSPFTRMSRDKAGSTGLCIRSDCDTMRSVASANML